MRGLFLAWAAALLVAVAASAWAQQAPSQADRVAAIRRAAAELKPQTGSVSLADGVARFEARRLAYLSPEDTRKLLVDIWGNPPNVAQGNLGALVPQGFDALSDSDWAIIMFYTEDGHVADDDAEKIDYADLLKSMQQSVRDQNEERRKEGFEGLELVGWARPPYYDKAAHKLHWAKHLRSVGGDSLNYNVRMLGRRGVLVLNFVAPMESLKQVENAIPSVLAEVNFTDGNRYDQYEPGNDKLAEYGIAALIAGVALKKVGFFAVIIGFILAAKKIFIIGAVAVLAGFARFFKCLGRGSRLPPPSGS